MIIQDKEGQEIIEDKLTVGEENVDKEAAELGEMVELSMNSVVGLTPPGIMKVRCKIEGQ